MEINIALPEIRSEVDVGTFGVSRGNPDNTAALRAALDYAEKNPGTRLRFPEAGVYRFDTAGNIRISGTDIELDGCGAELRFTKKCGFTVEGARRAVIKNLFYDWDWENAYRLADMLLVVGTGDGWVDFAHTEVGTAQDVPWMTINQYDAETLTPGCEGGKEYWAVGDRIKVSRCAERPNVSHVVHGGVFDKIRAGEVYCLRYETYGTNAFVLVDSRDVTFEDVTVWSTAGMGFIITGGSSHYRFDRCVVGLRPGTNRRMSATADSMHIGNSCGFGIVEHCDFSFAGDDGINIHDNVGLVGDVSGGAVTVQKRLVCSPGDSIGLLGPDGVDSGITLTARTVADADDKNRRVTFEEPIPDRLRAGAILSNRKFDSAYYIFRNNYFHENRARGLLLGSSHGLVENNVLYKTQGAAIRTVIDIAPGWSEGTGVVDLVVRNNKFIDCNVNDWTPMIEIHTVVPEPSDGAVFRDLVFEGNIFSGMPSEAIFAENTDGLVIRGNVFAKPRRRRSDRDDCGTITGNAVNAEISDNFIFGSEFAPNLGECRIPGAAVSGNKLIVAD